MGCQLKLLSQIAVETKPILIISKDLCCIAAKWQSVDFLALVQFDILALAILDSIDKGRRYILMRISIYQSDTDTTIIFSTDQL